jgi:tRNA A-37 threonylcarbamoyl transferase component Bud32
MIDYYQKYIKYKIKYITLSEKINGTYSNLSYLGQGAESIVFKMQDGKVLKIYKNFKNENENVIINELIKYNFPNFPKYHALGQCKNKDLITNETKTFCIKDTGTNYTYNYIIMDEIKGNDMLDIFFTTFQKYLLQDIKIAIDLEKEINMFCKFFLKITIKIAEALQIAYKEINFRHNDLDFRNCLIEGDIPTILDFGQATIHINESECRDIMSFINSSLSDSYCNKKESLNKFFKEDTHITVIKNCKIIKNKIKENNIIIKILAIINDCKPFYNKDIKIETIIKKLNEINIS